MNTYRESCLEYFISYLVDSREKPQGGGFFFGFFNEASKNKNPTPWGFS